MPRTIVIEEAVDDEERLLGYGVLASPALVPEDQAFLRVIVARAQEGRGVGGQLRAALMRRLPPGTTRLSAGVDDDDPRSLDVARHWGFEVQEHSIASRLDLTVLPVPDPPEGVSLHECLDLEFADPEAVGQVLRASQTNPEARAGWVFTLESLAAQVGDDLPVCVLARVDGEPAAMSFGTVKGATRLILYSGVDPARRGRGLMKLVKQQAHLVAARLGASESRTVNEEHNVGIRRINEALGYVPTSGVFRLSQQLRD
jgi:GNAT superfamily N-acetyltransferase